MTETKIISANSLKKHWFWPAAFAVVAVNVMVLAIDGWQAPRIKEFGVLFDFALLIPALYFICYRTSGKKAFVRTIAFACLGVWVAGHVVPDTHHFLISQIDWVRYVGLAVLVVIEIRLAIEIWRLAFRGHAEDASQAIREKAEKEGVPPWVAKLMAAEAKFWKKLWRFARKLLGRSS
jgi:hypothetical protein